MSADALRFDRGDFDVTAVPPVTATGDPWTRWVKSDEYSGWLATGRVKLSGREPKFWRLCLRLLCRMHGTRPDRVHSAGPGVLALGALGSTLATDAGVRVLGACLHAAPLLYMETMGPAMALGFFYPHGTELQEGRHRGISLERLRELVLLGSDGKRWTSLQKERARTWVTAISTLLAKDEMVTAQANALSTVLPGLMTEETRRLVKWPREVDGLWQYTREQQGLWLFAAALSTIDADVTTRLLGEYTREATYGTLASVGAALTSLEGVVGEAARVLFDELRVEDLWREEERVHP